MLAEARDRRGKGQDLCRHAKRPDAENEWTVRGGHQMQGPRRLGVPQAGKDVDEARFGAAELSGGVEKEQTHGALGPWTLGFGPFGFALQLKPKA
jgi:hypothetical protein